MQIPYGVRVSSEGVHFVARTNIIARCPRVAASDDDGVVDAGSRIQGGEGCETGDKKLTGGGESSIKDGRAGGASRGRGARPTGRRLGCADTTEISVFDIFSSDEEDEDEDEEEVGKEKLH